ncbi:MAG: hypothetical protein Q9Q40_12990 [Acidobacteriota bacterium]|nr:hypothetical protein [Acidobacteriota bacterium]MDQ7087196.1 hypothetical protein [Acidobacteriota bacterium]
MTGGELASLLADAARLCPGVRRAVLVDLDGVLVDGACFDPALDGDLEELGAEALGGMAAAAGLLRAARIGDSEEVIVTGSGGIAVLRRVPSVGLVLVLDAGPEPYLGRMRLAGRVLAGRLADRLGPAAASGPG